MKKLFGCNPEFESLLSKTDELSFWQRHFTSVTPPHLTHSCQALGIRQGILSIAAPNPIIAAKLRQLAPELTTLMRNKGCEVNGIHFKVQVSFDSYRAPSPSRKLSQTAKLTLREFSENLNESQLKQALLRLAEN